MSADDMNVKPDKKALRVASNARVSDASEVRVEPASDAPLHSEQFEGDYRPSPDALNGTVRVEIPEGHITGRNEGMDIPPTSPSHPENRIRVSSEHVDFLVRLAEALNNTLDLQTLMLRVAELVRAVVDYRIFAILLINDRTQELWMRFQVGHTSEVERTRIKLGRGVVGQAAQTRSSILIDDVRHSAQYLNANPAVQSELAVPLIVKNRVIGVIDLESEQLAAFTQDQKRLLELVASRMAVAIENARLYTRLSRQAQTLTVLSEISRELTSILDLDALLERIGTLLKRVVDFQMFTILLWSESRQQFVHRFSTSFGERVQRDRNAMMGEGIFGIAAQEQRPILVSDVRKDARYVGDSTAPKERGSDTREVRSMLTVPLIYKQVVTGLISLEHTRVNYYNEDHQRTLGTLAGQIAISIANARLYDRIFQEEQRMERDLAMAREVQMRLLPPIPAPMPNVAFGARFLPARSIGGDVYDFIPYGEGRVAIAVGDVSGKAAPAALYAALVSGILRSLAAQHLAPALMLAALNDQLQQRKLDSQYVTMLFAVWEDTSRTMQIANAGSVQPLLVSCDGGKMRARVIQAEGFPLGLFPNTEYEEFSISTQPGDLLVFFSDGIVDAENMQGDMFGTERLAEVLETQPHHEAEAAVVAVLDAVAAFQGGKEHFDDETLVILRVQ